MVVLIHRRDPFFASANCSLIYIYYTEHPWRVGNDVGVSPWARASPKWRFIVQQRNAPTRNSWLVIGDRSLVVQQADLLSSGPSLHEDIGLIPFTSQPSRKHDVQTTIGRFDFSHGK
jgi:hypothetical protein